MATNSELFDEAWTAINEPGHEAAQHETDPFVCFCGCHFYPVLHRFPCCHPCPDCGKRIKRSAMDKHALLCEQGPRSVGLLVSAASVWPKTV